ncbi:hypothetical protein Nepgr_031506 [Nepenthes gracilis]|uniref:Uncharacterized protein n=1 Tax=Nepenthes gracilis TaxID=150966 RepID=A0AAD3TIL3_NEPGR|nr:hypothetical protein Nepgr_031506 [Nepenthes gracilis]
MPSTSVNIAETVPLTPSTITSAHSGPATVPLSLPPPAETFRCKSNRLQISSFQIRGSVFVAGTIRIIVVNTLHRRRRRSELSSLGMWWGRTRPTCVVLALLTFKRLV